MRKFLTIIVYTCVVLLIGRNLIFLPRFSVLSSPTSVASDLKKETESIVKGKKGNYGVYFSDLTSGQNFGIHEREMFTAASVNKVPIVAVLYYLEHQGKVDFNDQITLQKRDIQDYGTGSLRYQKPGSTYSIKTLAKLALQQSDNTAAHILGERIGLDVVQDTITSWGLTQTDMEENQTTPYDMYLLFKKIYNHELTTDARSKELLSFMQDTDIEDRIPALLSSGTIVYHKTGDAVGSLNDVGIIMHDNKPFFLAVLTSDIGNTEAETKTTIATIAKSVIDYRDKRK
jgi:beta-lactamase class A